MLTSKARYLLFILAGVAAIAISNYVFIRADLTEDGRYSVSESSKNLLSNLDPKTTLRLEILFTGEQNADYGRLRKSLDETISEFQLHASIDIDVETLDPTLIENDTAKFRKLYELSRKGVKVRYYNKEKVNALEQGQVVPGAILYAGNGIEFPINFIKDGANGMEPNFDQTINEIEYELISAIKSLTDKSGKLIAFVEGHGELPEGNTQRVRAELKKYYGNSYFVNLSEVVELTKKQVEVLIIAKPTEPFTEVEKYKLDQYVLSGGNLLLFIDQLELKTDTSGFVGKAYDLNLSNLMRSWGVRMQGDFVLDFNCAERPIGNGNRQTIPQKYPLLPIFNAFADHPITSGLNPLIGQYVGSIDTVKALGVKKTPLIFSSEYSKVKGGDLVAYSINEIQMSQDRAYYTQSNVPVAYLCEGEMNSVYANRPKPLGVDIKAYRRSGKGRVIVVGDGDLIKNPFNPQTKQTLETGTLMFNPNNSFANKSFVMNAINYLADEEGIVQLRSRQIKPRPLEVFAIDETAERTKWQILNLVVPVVLILLFGGIKFFLRKRKYA